MVDVEVEFETELSVKATAEQAFGLVSDIARSAGHFPGLQDIAQVDAASGRWRWRMQETGVGPIKLKIVYDALYESDADALSVRWSAPPTGGGDMDSFGSWKVVPDGAGCRLRFSSRTVAHVPAPRLMAKMVEVIAQEELGNRMKQYTAAIAATLDGA